MRLVRDCYVLGNFGVHDISVSCGCCVVAVPDCGMAAASYECNWCVAAVGCFGSAGVVAVWPVYDCCVTAIQVLLDCHVVTV